MSEFIVAIGLVLVIEGLVFAGFPAAAKRLAASAMESARLLLNSKSTQFPNGLANSSGVVGKYLTDTTGAGVSGFIPAMVDHIPHNPIPQTDPPTPPAYASSTGDSAISLRTGCFHRECRKNSK